METNQSALPIFKEEIEIKEHTFNIDIKQELVEDMHSVNVINNIIGETNLIKRPIKQEVNVHSNTVTTLEESDALIKQESNIIESIGNNLNYLHRKWRRTRTRLKGSPLIGKHIKRQGIIICAVCGNLYTKNAEYFYHYSIHSLMNKKLCKTELNRRDASNNLINLNEEIKYNFEIVENKVKEELEETKNCAQFNGVDNYKQYSHGIVENAELCLHTSRKQQPQCVICFKYFSNKGNLETHMRIHAGKKRFKCEICYKSYTLKCNLVRHMRIHTAEKQCEICCKSFTFHSGLVHHMPIHTDEKPFKCEICLKSFKRKFCIVQHMRIHTGEKPFKCEICYKSFTFKCSLARHIRIHTAENPFKCEICLKSFAVKSSIAQHMRIHTAEEPFNNEMKFV